LISQHILHRDLALIQSPQVFHFLEYLQRFFRTIYNEKDIQHWSIKNFDYLFLAEQHFFLLFLDIFYPFIMALLFLFCNIKYSKLIELLTFLTCLS
jgi:hypothetical protein